jgi:hypothetical protein
VLWDLPHEEALLQPWGTPRAMLTIRDGAPLTFIAGGRTKEGTDPTVRSFVASELKK